MPRPDASAIDYAKLAAAVCDEQERRAEASPKLADLIAASVAGTIASSSVSKVDVRLAISGRRR